MKKPFGERDGPTEPFDSDADVDDGPTVRVFVPDDGPAQIMGIADFAGEPSADAMTLKQRAPSFSEVTNSDFYTTRTNETEQEVLDDARTLERRPLPKPLPLPRRRELPNPSPGFDAAKTLERRPAASEPDLLDGAQTLERRGSLPSFADQAPADLVPVDSAEAWTVPRPPSPPLPTQPIPLVPPMSRPFNLVPKQDSMRLSRTSKADADIEVSAALSPLETAASGPPRASTLISPQPVPMPPIPESFPEAPKQTAPPAWPQPSHPPGPEVEIGRPEMHSFVPKGSIAPPGAPRPAHPSLSPSPLDVTKDRTLLAAAVGVFGALTFGGLIAALLFLLLRDTDAPPRPPPQVKRPKAAAAATTNETAATAPRCRLVLPPRQLLAQALPQVRPQVATAPGMGLVAVGVAADRNEARGLIVNTQDLSTEVRLAETLSGPVLRVTPLPGRSPATFVVNSQDPRIQMLRTAPATPPYKLGHTRAGIVRVDPGREPSLVWAGNYSDMGEPEFVTVPRVGTAVAFRRGSTSSDVVFGWLGPNGSRATSLVRVDLGPREAERPVLASNDDSIALAVAGGLRGEPKHIYVARADHGKLPPKLRRVDETPSTEAERHPSLIAFDRGYILSWVAGAPGAQRLRGRTLARDLSPQGPVLELSSVGVADAPGALIARQGRVLAAHFRSGAGRVELWGSALSCR